MIRRKKLALLFGLGLPSILLLAVVSALLVAQSGWFREKVRQRIVREVEQTTGGRAEIGSFVFDWQRLHAEVRSFVLHGTEKPDEPPLFRAQSVQVGLNIISAFRRDIDIDSLLVKAPEVHIIVYPDGRTNFPQPKVTRRREKNAVEQFLDLAIRRFSLERGSVEFASRRVPLNVRGERLRARLFYEANAPRCTGQLSVRQLQLTPGTSLPLAFDVDSSIVIAGDRIELPDGRFTAGQSSVQVAGAVRDFHDPRAEFSFDAELSLKEMGGRLRLPIAHQGRATLRGKVSYSGVSDYSLAGNIRAAGLAVERAGVRVGNIGVASRFEMTPGRIELAGLTVVALGGTFSGRADVRDLKRLRIKGHAENLSVQELAQVRNVRAAGWSGLVSGPLTIEGELAGSHPRGFKVQAQLSVTAAAGDLPVEGSLAVSFDQQAGVLELGDSYLTTPDSRVHFDGALGQDLHVELESRNLDDVLPVATSLTAEPPKALPVSLQNGLARFSGRITGELGDPLLSGRASLTNFTFRGHRFDSLSADVAISAGGVGVRNLRLEQDKAHLRGELQVGLRDWKSDPAGTLAGAFSVSHVELERLLAEAGRKFSLRGRVSGTIALDGTAGAPAVSGSLLVIQPVVYGQLLDRAKLDIRYAGRSLEIPSAQLTSGPARIQAKGVFTHRLDDWRNGTARFEFSANRVSLSQARLPARLPAGLDGIADAEASGGAALEDSKLRLTALNGRLSLRKVTLNQRPAGNLELTAETRNGALTVSMEGEVAGAAISGHSLCQLGAEYPVQGELRFSRLALSGVRPWWTPAGNGEALPLDAVAQGVVAFSGLALEPESWGARVEIPSLEITPQGNAKAGGFGLHNTGPVVLEIDRKALRIESARFSGENTNLEATGTIGFQSKNSAYQIRVRGGVDLAVLHNLERNLTASGDSALDATIRGPFSKPEVYGRLEFKDGSLYLSNVPNGIDKASGVIFFFRDRATIEKIAAETGGGKLTFGGFVGFGGDQLSYRLNVSAEDVRVRYPEGVSTSLNASLNLTGTSTRSLLSGAVTILRSGVNPRVDFAGLLAQSSKPMVLPATQNELLRGMQFDVRVETSPDARFETTLTRDIQAEADLRLRGTPYRPVLLGRVSITQGEINFLGNRYTINRGDISFLNPVKLEPTLNLDLETRVRGIDVTLTFSGPLNKLSANYRSDPPLQVNEIIALLAVGRAPSSDVSVAARRSQQDQSWQQIGASTLVGQALAAPVAGRLQRFFGVSRIKIDPRFTGVENNPQAQLTLEQQVSKDITFTYITNLSQGQQQVVRVEWNVNRRWSILAVREENGLFGVDFLYRKQFK